MKKYDHFISHALTNVDQSVFHFITLLSKLTALTSPTLDLFLLVTSHIGQAVLVYFFINLTPWTI